MPSEEGTNYEIKTDEQLISDFQNGEEDAYLELVNRYKDRLMNYVFRFTGSYDDSEDIVQDTLVRVYISKHLYKEIAKFSTWIFTIAINLAKTRAINKKKYKIFSFSNTNEDEKDFDLPDDAFQPDIEANDKYLDMHIQKALNSISPRYRELVILRDVDDFSYEEICDITGLPMGTVKSRINRGREKLQELLKDIYKDQ